MNQFLKLIRVSSAICLIGLALFLSYYDSRAGRQNIKPGSTAIMDKNTALEIGGGVAFGYMTPGVSDIKIVNVRAQKLSEVPADQVRSLDGKESSTMPILASYKNEIWLVTYSGSFTTRHHPAGSTGHPYSHIDIFLNSKDGSVIGVDLYNP